MLGARGGNVREEEGVLEGVPRTELNQTAVNRMLPHGNSAIYVNEAVVTGDRCIAKVRLRSGHRLFQGHFPGSPILMGAMHAELAAQAALVLFFTLRPDRAGRQPVLTGTGEQDFRRSLRPEETLEIEVSIKRERLGTYHFGYSSTVDDARVAGGVIKARFVKTTQ